MTFHKGVRALHSLSLDLVCQHEDRPRDSALERGLCWHALEHCSATHALLSTTHDHCARLGTDSTKQAITFRICRHLIGATLCENTLRPNERGQPCLSVMRRKPIEYPTWWLPAVAGSRNMRNCQRWIGSLTRESLPCLKCSPLRPARARFSAAACTMDAFRLLALRAHGYPTGCAAGALAFPAALAPLLHRPSSNAAAAALPRSEAGLLLNIETALWWRAPVLACEPQCERRVNKFGNADGDPLQPPRATIEAF